MASMDVFHQKTMSENQSRTNNPHLKTKTPHDEIKGSLFLYKRSFIINVI